MEQLCVAHFLLDRIQPAAETTELIVFGVGVSQVAGQNVAFDGVDALLGASGVVLGFGVLIRLKLLGAFPPALKLPEFFVESRAVACEMFAAIR